MVPSLDARVAIELGKAAVAAVEAAEATPGTSLLTALGDGLSVARAMRRKLEPGVQIPGWTLEGWLGSLDLTGLVARAITEKLHARVAQAGGGSAGRAAITVITAATAGTARRTARGMASARRKRRRGG